MGEEKSAVNSKLLGQSYGTLFQPGYVRQISRMSWIKSLWKREKLLIFIVLAVLLGLLVGLLINKPVQELEEPAKGNVLLLVGFPGEILMRMLKMLILPLIMTSLIVGLADLDQRSSGRLGRRAVLYYMFTTGVAVLLGIILVVSIKPGSYGGDKEFNKDADQPKTRTMDTILDLLRNMFPENIVQACIEQAATRAEEITIRTDRVYFPIINGTEMSGTIEAYNSTHNVSITKKTVLISGKTTYRSGTNVLGVVVFSIAIGLLLGKMGTQAHSFIQWIKIFNELIMKLVQYVMWYSPIGIWSLVTNKFASMDDISGTFQGLAYYMATVISGLVVHSFIVLPLTYFVLTRRNPFSFIKGTAQALLTAFGTSSSSATLPVTFKCLEDNNGLDKRVTRFVLPIGATINMDGTALYEAVAAIFIAQSTGMSLNIGQYIAISLTATLASIGAAGIPQAGLVTMLMVLQTVGLPEEAVTLIISVDWFLDRIRTTVNVLGDCIGAGIVAHLSEGDLENPLENSYENEINIVEDVIRNGSKTSYDIQTKEHRNASTTSF
uniref:Amino acid transporter n=1 Tax=Clytia hemisphaerica TaxID=252671 RepID=A0A069DMR3_9CNID